MKLQEEWPILTSQVDGSKLQKTTWKCNADLFGPDYQLWSFNLKCMRDSKPQRCAQQHNTLKVTQNATNEDKYKKEASKKNFANNKKRP